MVTGAAWVGPAVTDVGLTINRATKGVVPASINNVILGDAFPAAPDLTALGLVPREGRPTRERPRFLAK